jgi:hypothetical protein
MQKLNYAQLKRFCDEHGIDEQLIDATLTYDENMKVLRGFTYVEPSSQETAAQEAWYNDQSYAERFGDLPEGEVPPQFVRSTVFFVSRRMQVKLHRTKHGQVDVRKEFENRLLRLLPLVKFIMQVVPDIKTIEKIHRCGNNNYVTVIGTIEDVTKTIDTLTHYGNVRTVRTSHIHDSRVQYIERWVLRPTEPQLVPSCGQLIVAR